MIKITAVTKKDFPIVSILMDADDVSDNDKVLTKIETELSRNESREAFLRKWVNDGYLIKIQVAFSIAPKIDKYTIAPKFDKYTAAYMG